MFLLLGIGFLCSAGALISEWVGGCSKKCRSIIVKRRDDKRRAELHIDENSNPVSRASPRDSEESGKREHRRKSSTVFPRGQMIEYGEHSLKGDDEGDMSYMSTDSRRTSVSLNIFNRQTLREMCSGNKKRRHSNVIIMNGEITTDTRAMAHLHLQHEKHEFDHLDRTVHSAEINPPPRDLGQWNLGDNQKIIDGLFGEEIH